MFMLPLFTFLVSLVALCAGMETGSDSPYRTPSSSSHSPPGELKRSPSRRQPAKRPVEVGFSAFFIDRDVIRIAQQIYTDLKFDKFLDTLSPTESLIDEHVLFLSVVGSDDDFKVYSRGTKAALVIPVDPSLPGIVEDLQEALGYKRPIYRLTWTAEMERTKNSKERYSYILEADYMIIRANNTPSTPMRRRVSKRNRSQSRKSSKQATTSGSRSVSRSSSCNDFREMEQSPESEESADPYKAEYHLFSVNVGLYNVD